jgi:hypothetical protein
MKVGDRVRFKQLSKTWRSRGLDAKAQGTVAGIYRAPITGEIKVDVRFGSDGPIELAIPVDEMERVPPPSSSANQMTPAQCRAARALIDMSHAELAGAAVVPIAAIIDFETGAATPRPPDLTAIQSAFEQARVEFTDRGVRLKAGKEPRPLAR